MLKELCTLFGGELAWLVQRLDCPRMHAPRARLYGKQPVQQLTTVRITSIMWRNHSHQQRTISRR